MEVDLAREGHHIPAHAAVSGLKQPQVGGRVHALARVPRGEPGITGAGEAHHVERILREWSGFLSGRLLPEAVMRAQEEPIAVEGQIVDVRQFGPGRDRRPRN